MRSMVRNGRPEKQTLGQELAEFRRRSRFTQKYLGETLLGLSPGVYKNYEYDHSTPSEETLEKLKSLGFRQSVSALAQGLPEGKIEVPYLGSVSQGANSEGTRQLRISDSQAVYDGGPTRPIPTDMCKLHATLTATLEDDSLMPMARPNDLLIFWSPDARERLLPRLGKIALHRSSAGALAVGVVSHDGTYYIVSPINRRYEPVLLDGEILGYLVAWKRETSRGYQANFDTDGLDPD